jgi:hypothetical protein
MSHLLERVFRPLNTDESATVNADVLKASGMIGKR